MILVINANTNTCKFYDYNKHKAELKLVHEIQQPENKLKDFDLNSDRPGHYQKNGPGTRGAYSPPKNTKEIKIEDFLRNIAKKLEHQRTQNTYEKFIIIAPPAVNGLLHQHMDKLVKELVINNIKKDLIHLNDHDLLSYIREHAQYAD